MKRVLTIFVLACASLMAHAAGSCTVTNVTSSQNANARVPDSFTVQLTVTCIGDAATGSFPAVTIPLTGSSSGTLNAYNLMGYYLYQVDRTPGNVTQSNTTCSATCPTASYTTVITDIDGFNIDLGLLTTNGSATAAQMTVISNSGTNYPKVRNGGLKLQVSANSVASAKITLDLMFIAQ